MHTAGLAIEAGVPVFITGANRETSWGKHLVALGATVVSTPAELEKLAWPAHLSNFGITSTSELEPSRNAG